MSVILISAFGVLIAGILSMIWFFYMEFYNWVHGEANTMIEGVFNSVGLDFNIPWLDTTFNTINYFFPLDATMTAIMAILSLWFVVLSVKITLKIIPTVY